MSCIHFQGYLLLGLLGVFIGPGKGLKDVRVSVPHAIKRGETAVFMCDFDLEGDPLYTVKWYKGKKEFFRYTPKDEYPIKTFPLEDLTIDTSKSNMSRLTILRVEPSLSGKYNCEVSAEASFHTFLVSGVMDVVEVPYQGPIIEGLKPKYRIGENLTATCKSGKSNPAANITWTVNGEMPSPNQVTRFLDDSNSSSSEDRLVSTKLGISFTVKSHDFVLGHLQLKCSATIHNIYHQSVERSIDEERSRLNADSTQIVVLPANYLEDIDENGHKKRRYSSGQEPNASRIVRRTWSSLSLATSIVLLILILR